MAVAVAMPPDVRAELRGLALGRTSRVRLMADLYGVLPYLNAEERAVRWPGRPDLFVYESHFEEDGREHVVQWLVNDTEDPLRWLVEFVLHPTGGA